jgi:hypothetical protein
MTKKRPLKPKEMVIPSLNDESEVPTKPVPTFVTEVVESDSENGELEQATESHNSDQTQDNLEEIVSDVVEPVDKPVNQPTESETEEKLPAKEYETKASEPANQKQVVEELFSKRDSGLTEISVGRKNRHSPFLWALIVIVAAATTGIGLLIFSGTDTKKITIIPQPSPTVIPVLTPTVMPTPTIVRADISVSVLNGGGVPGAASKMKSFLAEKGYSVIEVGNTEDYEYEETEIRVKKSLEAVLSVIETDLASEYTVGTKSSDIMDSAQYDLQVIVGKK